MPPSKPDVQDVWKHGSHRHGIVWRRRGLRVSETDVKNSIWWEPGHNENECRNLSAGVEEDLEANVT